MELSAPQSDFFSSNSKATALVSGFGAGKTVAAITRILATKIQYPSVDLLYASPTYPLIRDILYPEISDICEDAGIAIKINRADNHINFPQIGGKIICKTMEKPERLIGFSVGDAFLDELDVLDTDKAMHVWRMVLARIRSKFPDNKKNQIFVSTTPEGWKATYQLFVKKQNQDYKLIKASTRSNTHLPEDYIQSLIASYPPHLIEAYIEGEFVNLTSGTVYPNFSRTNNLTSATPTRGEKLFVGIDFNAYHMAAIVHVIRNNFAFAVNEFIDLDDTPAVIAAIQLAYPAHSISFFPDSTGIKHNSTNASQTDISLLKNHGFAVHANPTNPRIVDRVNSFNAVLSGDLPNYFVNPDTCPTLVDCLEKQSYDDQGRPDKKSGFDHPLDAAGYFVYKWRPIKRAQAYNYTGNWK